jgi:large subunit ribosomal protein L7/L12
MGLRTPNVIRRKKIILIIIRGVIKMADVKKFIEEVKSMTVLELNELVKALEEEFGVSAAAPVAVAAAPAAGAAAAAEVEEKTEFNVVLKDAGAKKIDVIKVVRAFTGLGLVEAKAAVEKGGVLKENVAKEEAEKILADLKAAGATAVLD